MESNQRRVISLLVDNQSGVLARVSNLFCRRGFNIDSLTVSATNDPTVSRITVSVSGTEKELQQLILQTERLEVTRQVFVLNESTALERELLLLKVVANVTNRAELREIAGIYKAKIIDLSPDSMVFELTGRPEKIDAFLKLMSDYQILEQCRTGVTALERGGMHQHIQKPAQEVREAQFPLPGTRCHYTPPSALPRCHLSYRGEALAFRKTSSLRQRLPSVGELSSECETERLPLAFPLPGERKIHDAYHSFLY